MDTLTLAIVLLVAFIAYQQGVLWLAVAMLALFVLLIRNIGITVLVLGGFAVMYFLKLQQHWFAFMVVIIGLAVVLNERKKPGGAGEEMMSPELMQLLSEAGGGERV